MEKSPCQAIPSENQLFSHWPGKIGLYFWAEVNSRRQDFPARTPCSMRNLGYMGFPVPAKELQLGHVEDILITLENQKEPWMQEPLKLPSSNSPVLPQTSEKLVLRMSWNQLPSLGACCADYSREIWPVLNTLQKRTEFLGIFVSHLSEHHPLKISGTEVRMEWDWRRMVGLPPDWS